MPIEKPVTLDRKLWLTEDGDKLVEHGDPDARFLFGVAGRRMNGAECKRLKYRPNAKLAADDETAQILASDAEKQAEIEKKELAAKEAEASETKEAKKIADKERKEGADKGGK